MSLIPGMEKIFASEGYFTIFCQSLFVCQCRKTLQRFINLRVSKNVRDKRKWMCFRIYPVAKKFMDKTGREGVSRFFVEVFLSHSAEKICRGSF